MKWADLLPIILAVITLAGGGGGVWSLLTVGKQKRQLVAQANQLEAQGREQIANTVKTLGAAAADMVEPLQRTLALAEARADTLNAQLQQARAEVGQLRTETERAYEDLRRIRLAVMDPNATIAGLRALVESLGNGRT